MMKIKWFFIPVMFVLLITACSNVTVEQTMEATTAPEAAEPEVDENIIAGSSFPEDIEMQLDAFIQSQVYSEGGDPEGATPGLVLFVETPQGQYLKAAGVSNIESGTPMQPGDILEIGSNSKSFTIVVLMQLQEEGLLSFDDLLSDWLPEYAAEIPNGDVITLFQLANNISGIWDYGDAIIGEAANNPDKLEEAYTPQELIQYAIDNGTPDFAPGEGWNYSNTGFILLGLIAESASGQSLSDLYQERIFEPLGLDSAVLIEGVPQEGELTTQGYSWTEDGTRLNTTNWNVSQGWAAGGIAMTAEDLAAYLKSLAAGDLFENPDSLDQMKAFNEASIFNVGASYGLGIMDFGDGYFGHEGQTAGFQSLMFTNPESQVTVIGLTNSAAYSAYAFLNVRNILDGVGLQPYTAVTLLPVADIAPDFTMTKWQWIQWDGNTTSEPVESVIQISLSKNGEASITDDSCGSLFATFEANPPDRITFVFDTSSFNCSEDEPVMELLNYLQQADSWGFENGRWVIKTKDGTTLIFKLFKPEL